MPRSRAVRDRHRVRLASTRRAVQTHIVVIVATASSCTRAPVACLWLAAQSQLTALQSFAGLAQWPPRLGHVRVNRRLRRADPTSTSLDQLSADDMSMQADAVSTEIRFVPSGSDSPATPEPSRSPAASRGFRAVPDILTAPCGRSVCMDRSVRSSRARRGVWRQQAWFGFSDPATSFVQKLSGLPAPFAGVDALD